MTTAWRSTAAMADLDYGCDYCGAAVNTVHFKPWISDTTEVLFACPDHDPGGYWMEFRRLFTGPRDWRSRDPAVRYTGLDHIMDKGCAGPAIRLLAERMDALRRLADVAS